MIDGKKYKKRVVVKVGTNVMTNNDNRIVNPILRQLVSQIARLYEEDIITVLISSARSLQERRSFIPTPSRTPPYAGRSTPPWDSLA